MAAELSRRASLLAAAGAVGLLGVGADAVPAAALAEPGTLSGPGDVAGPTGIFVLGDSWAAGLFADPARALGQVAAGVFDTTADVDAIPGTGYVNAAGMQNYLARAGDVSGDPRLVVVQGGSNDVGFDLGSIAANAKQTLQVLQQRLPAAQIVMLGPGPDPDPVTADQRAVDATLQSAADAARVPYVSMLQEGWIPSALADSVIDPETEHPTIAGQQYLGIRLAASVALLYPDLMS